MGELVSVVAGDKDEIHDTTAEEFLFFQSSCRKYQKLFSLIDWDLYFCLEDLSEDAEMANISWCFNGHSCRITLSSKIPLYDDYMYEMEKVARHEIIHILLARIQEYSQRRNVIQSDIDEAIESLVRMIDNVFLSGRESVCDCQTQICQCDK
jgi:hypothetical protein